MNGIIQARQLYVLGTGYSDPTTNIDPAVYRYIGKFTLATVLMTDTFVPLPNTMLVNLDTNRNDWYNVYSFSFDITSVNGSSKLTDFFDGVFTGTGVVKRFVFRSRVSDSSFSCAVYMDSVNGSTVDNINYNVNVSNSTERTKVKIITYEPRFFSFTGTPKPGEPYDLYWTDLDFRATFDPVIQSERAIAQMFSTATSQSTVVVNYQNTYSTLLNAVNFSSILSTTFITEKNSAEKNMEFSTTTYSTTFQTYSTIMANYISSLSTLSAATAAASSISTLAKLSTPVFQVELNQLSPELNRTNSAFLTSTLVYDYCWSTLNALSTSSDIMNAVLTTFRAQTTSDAISTLNSAYPNLSTILLSMTGDRSLYQRGGAALTADQLLASEFQSARISTFIRTMMDEQTQFALLSTFSSAWATESVERARRLSSISSVEASSNQLYAESIAAGNLARQYDIYYTSTIAATIPYVEASTLEAKKMSLHSLGVDISRKTAAVAAANTNIQMADNILELLNANLADPYELYMDQIPKEYAPLVPNSGVPDPSWSVTRTIEIADPANMWKTRDWLVLIQMYGDKTPFYFKYEGKEFYAQFGATASSRQSITLMVDRNGTGTWTPATAADIPMSVDTASAVAPSYTYRTLQIQMRSAVLVFADPIYGNVINTFGDYQALLSKYGTNNWIYFTLGAVERYRLRFTNIETDTTAVQIQILSSNTWTTPNLSQTTSGRLSMILEPFVTTISFSSQSSINNIAYHNILFNNFGTDSIYFLYKDGVNTTRMFRMKFAPKMDETTHDVTVDQWLRTNQWGPPEIQFPVGQEVAIQLTIGVTNPTEVEAQKAVFVGQRDTLRGELDGMLIQKETLETDVGEKLQTISSNVIASWSNWVTSTLEVEAKAFEDYQQNLKDASSLFLAYQASTAQMASDAYIEEKRQSTFISYDGALRSSISTYQSKMNAMFSIESALQSTIRAIGENWSDITNDQTRCAEIRSRWDIYLKDYGDLKSEYDRLTQKRLDIAYSTGRSTVASPEIPNISTMSSIAENACRTVNFVSDISYSVQSGGAAEATSTMSSIQIIREKIFSISNRISTVMDTQAAIQLQTEALAQYNEASKNYADYRNDQLIREMSSFRNTLLELSTSATYGIAKWRYKQVVNPEFSTVNMAGLTYMRYVRNEMVKFMAAMENEKAMREQYAEILAEYNDQQYRIKGRLEKAYSADQFRDLTTSLDLTIGTCNSYTKYRKGLYDDLQSKIQYASTMRYFPDEIIAKLYESTNVTYAGQSNNLDARFPIPMNFDLLPPRLVTFQPGGVLPVPIPACVSTSVSSAPVNQDTLVAPTTTLDTRACGVKARFVEFTNIPGGIFEATQIVVIDKDGRNVAFGRIVSLLPGAGFTRNLTNGGAYSSEMATRLGGSTQILSTGGITGLRIDLGSTFDITAVRYMKAAASQFDPSAMRVSLKDAAYTEVASRQLFVNLPTVVVDFRSALSSACAITVLPTRYGTCGLMARYVRLLPPSPFPPMFQFQLSQVVVVNSMGMNLASNRYVAFYMNGQRVSFSGSFTTDTVTSLIGNYRARARTLADAPAPIETNATGYLELDLGSEQDVAAVHLHNVVGGTGSLAGMRVQLFTEDLLQAGNDGLVVGNKRQEIVDFTYATADKNCSTALKWPSFYGQAGIIASGIQLTQPVATALTFGTIKVIDKAGRNVVLFRDVEVNPGLPNLTKNTAVQEAATPANIATPFMSAASTAGQYAKVMFAEPCEVCAVYVLAPSVGGGTALRSIRVNLLRPDGTFVGDASNTASFTIGPTNTQDIVFFDTRYNPDTSEFPTTETAPLQRYGQFSIYAQNVRIGPLPTTPTRLQAVGLSTDLGTNAKPFTVSFQSATAMWKSLDYANLLAVYPVNGTFFFNYGGKYFRGQFGASQTDTTHFFNISVYSNGEFITLSSGDIPFNSTSPSPTVIQVMSSTLTSTTGYLASNICLTDGTGKPILPQLVRPYAVSFSGPTAIWQLGDFAALLAAFPADTPFTFWYKYGYFRGTLGTTAGAITLQEWRDNTWQTVTSASDLDFMPQQTQPATLFVIEVFLNGASAAVTTDSAGTATLQLNFGRPFEVNSVLLSAAEFGTTTARTVTLIDCNSAPVASIFTGSATTTYRNEAWVTADFRRSKFDSPYSGPLAPLPVQYGPHNSGVLARYIEILAKDALTPLYISQIVAVNACGRNVAHMKDTYTEPALAASSTNTPDLAVDGIYEDEITPDFAQNVIYDAYRPKPADQSFKSGTGINTRMVIDLGKFVQTNYAAGDRTSLCNNQVTNGACGMAVGDQYTYNHEINCVIFVAPKGLVDEAEGVIVRLIDANGAVVGVQRVTRIVKLFGVDFLDFRRDTSRNLMYDLVERPRRNIETRGCGIMTQFVRVEQIPGNEEPIQMSQLFVVDIYNRNVALYKPTRSNSTDGSKYDLSWRAVDGKYYIKAPADGYMSKSGPGQNLEVNLGCPTPVMKVWIVNLNTGNAAVDNRRLSGMRIKLYNQNRDLIAVQTLSSSGSTTDPAGIRTLTISKSGEAKTISVVGTDIKARFFTQKYIENLIPVKPAGADVAANTQYSSLTLTGTGCDSNAITLDTTPSYTIGPNRGLLCYYVRIYNPNSYIQISQLLLFDGTGSCINRGLPQNAVFATHALPNRFPELATDCSGGFFHANRSEANCYISEMKPYEYWQVQVQDGAATAGREIIGLKYFPPRTNRVRNIGLRFQLLDKNQNVFSEYVLKEGEHAANEFWVDFRIRGPNPLEPLIQYCFPRVETILSGIATFSTPVGIDQGPDGTIFVSDVEANQIRSFTYSATTDSFNMSSFLPYQVLMPLEISWGPLGGGANGLYIAQRDVTTVITATNGTGASSTTIAPTAPLVGPAFATVWDPVKNCLYISWANGIGSSDGSLTITGLNQPASLVIRTLGTKRYLYVACKNNNQIRAYDIDTKQEEPALRIGKGTAPTAPVTVLSERPENLLLASPVGLAVDAMNNLFFSDEGTDSIYVVAPDISATRRTLVYRVAGTGVSGFSEGANLPATKCMIQKPQCMIYHRASGDILFVDMGNRLVRRIRILSMRRPIIAQNPTAEPIFSTTTVPQGVADPDVPANVPIVRTENRDRETIREFKAPARIETLD
jgi:hypothetical protein